MRPPPALVRAVAAAGGAEIRACRPLSGGCVAEVLLVECADGARFVAKLGAPGSALPLEAWMLEYLSRESRLPVPAVRFASDKILLLDYIDSGDALDASAQEHAAGLLADLHARTAPEYGLSRDTLIGGLPQPNAPSKAWIPFFRDRRLLHMARAALDERALATALFARIENLAARLDSILLEPEAPALIHGDMWGGNILCRDGRIAGFVDPAIYYADPEIELAFSTLFSTFGAPFFSRYRELRGIRPGFFEERCAIYNLYPLLVHLRLFGGGYAAAVEGTLARFGF